MINLFHQHVTELESASVQKMRDEIVELIHERRGDNLYQREGKQAKVEITCFQKWETHYIDLREHG